MAAVNSFLGSLLGMVLALPLAFRRPRPAGFFRLIAASGASLTSVVYTGWPVGALNPPPQNPQCTYSTGQLWSGQVRAQHKVSRPQAGLSAPASTKPLVQFSIRQVVIIYILWQQLVCLALFQNGLYAGAQVFLSIAQQPHTTRKQKVSGVEAANIRGFLVHITNSQRRIIRDFIRNILCFLTNQV